MKKKLLCMVLSLAYMFTLPKCQSATSGTEDGTTGETQENEQEEKVKLYYSFWGSTNEKDAITESYETFTTQDPNIEVEIIHIPVDYEIKLSAMITGGEEPDPANLGDYFAVPLVESDKLYDILDLIDQDLDTDRKDYLDFAYRYYSPDVAYDLNTAAELFATFYNKKIFENTGVEGLSSSMEGTSTVNEFIVLAQKLTLGSQGKNTTGPDFGPTDIVQYSLMFGFSVQQYMGAVYSNEGGYASEDGMRWTLNQPQSVEALQAVSDLASVYHIAPNPSELKALPSLAIVLQADKTAMIWASAWVALDLGLGDTEFDVGALPIFKEGAYTTYPAQGTAGIFKSTQHPEEAFKLWKWLMDPGNNIDLYASGLWVPLLTDYYQKKDLLDTWATVAPTHPSGYMGSHVGVVLDEYVAANPSGYVKNYMEINALVTPALESAFLGNENVQKALDRIAPDVEKLLEGRYNKQRFEEESHGKQICEAQKA